MLGVVWFGCVGGRVGDGRLVLLRGLNPHSSPSRAPWERDEVRCQRHGRPTGMATSHAPAHGHAFMLGSTAGSSTRSGKGVKCESCMPVAAVSPKARSQLLQRALPIAAFVVSLDGRSAYDSTAATIHACGLEIFVASMVRRCSATKKANRIVQLCICGTQMKMRARCRQITTTSHRSYDASAEQEHQRHLFFNCFWHGVTSSSL